MPASKRQPGRRVGWSKLTPGYRTRLARKGIDRSGWERGDDLRLARGHTPQRPAHAAPEAPTLRYVTNRGTYDGDRSDRAVLERFTRPGWIPPSVPYDVAAALSQLRGTPSSWASVRFVPSPSGEPWAMIVTPKGANLRDDGTSPYDQVILIPGGGAPGTGAREVLDLFYHPESSGVVGNDPRWRGWTSGRVGVAEPLPEPTTGYGERSDVLRRIEELLKDK